MKKVFLIAFLLCFTTIEAQSESHQKAADTFMSEFNRGQFDQIYQALSPKMQRVISRKKFVGFLIMVKNDIGNLVSLQLYNYTENNRKARGYYDGNFEKETATVRITTDQQGQIIGLFIRKKPAT